MIIHKMKAGLLDDLATAQFFPSIEPPMLPQAAVTGEGKRSTMPAMPGNVLGSPRPCPVPQICPSTEGPGPLGPGAGGKGCRRGREVTLSPAWVTTPLLPSCTPAHPQLSPQLPQVQQGAGAQGQGLIRANESSAV